MARESDSRAPVTDPEVGLCSTCRHASTQPGARGSVFWRCLAADRDRRLLRYPPLPVTRCPAHAPTRRSRVPSG